MPEKLPKIPEKLRVWIDARKRHGLSHAHIQMARELGMNPKSLGKLDNHRQEPWIQQRFDRFADRVEYWDIHDVDSSTPEEQLPLLRAKVRQLVTELVGF